MSVLSLYLSLRDNRLLTLFTHVIPYRVPENYYFQISNGTRLFILTIAVIILQILSHSLSVCLVCHLVSAYGVRNMLGTFTKD